MFSTNSSPIPENCANMQMQHVKCDLEHSFDYHSYYSLPTFFFPFICVGWIIGYFNELHNLSISHHGVST